MGIAIIKGLSGAYAIGRTTLVVTPKKESMRKVINSTLSDTRWELDNGQYKVVYINLGDATQPYRYTLCTSNGTVLPSQSGVELNELNGTITLNENYDGSAIYAKVVPIQDNVYYKTEKATSAVLVKEAGLVDNYTLTFVYNNGASISADSLEISMTSFVIKNNGTTVTTDKTTLTDVLVTAKVGNSTIASGTSIQSNLTIPSNESTSDRSIVITVSGKYSGNSVSNSYTLSQLKRASKVLTGITAEAKSPTKIAGSLLATSDFTVNEVFSDSSTQALASGFSMSPSSINSYGNNVITITYEGHSDTATIQGVDAISAITYNEALNSQEPKYVPDITATLGHSYLGYKLYLVNNTTNNNVTAYDFSISNPTTVIGSSNTTIQDFATISTNSTDLGNVSFNTNSLLKTIPSGGILTDTSVQIKVTNHNDDKDFLNCTIDNPLAYIVQSYNGQALTSSNGTCCGRSAGSSGLTAFVPNTKFTTGSTKDAWRYYSYDVTGVDYLIIVSSQAVSGIHSLIVLNSDVSFLNSNGKEVTVDNAVFTFLPSTTIYKLKGSSRVYLMHYKDDENIKSNPFTVYGFSLSQS